MASQLLQLKVDPAFKADLQALAEYKGLTLSAYIKMLLTELLRREKKAIYTENGLTEEEERELLRREKEALKDWKKGKGKVFSSAASVIRALNG